MKFRFSILLLVAALLTCTVSAHAESGLLASFAEDPYAYSSITLEAFSKDPADSPTDAELTSMLKFAMATSSAHSLTPAHFVVIRDAAEQKNVLSGLNMFGLEVPATEATVTVLVFGDTIRDQEHHADAYNGWYSQMYYGIYDAGAAAAYLSLAAQDLGYDVHQVAGLNIPLSETGEVQVFVTGGNFALVNGDFWDATKYLTSKDETVDFTHKVSQATMDGQTLTVNANGNLTLLSAIIIGKKANDVDTFTAATKAYPEDLANFNFWDPQDGVSYGNAIAAGEKVAPVVAPTVDLSQIADGVYSASSVSTSSEYTVQVEMKDGKIASIAITEGADKMLIGEEKAAQFINSIIENQSLNVDSISGATEDCNGIVNAVKSALHL